MLVLVNCWSTPPVDTAFTASDGVASTSVGDPRRAVRRGSSEQQGVSTNVIDVATKDCTALSDAELAEMADLCTDGVSGYEVGFLSKQREEWVLVTHAREEDKLRGFAFSTLERIGGTPSLLLGVASFTRTGSAESALKAVMRDLYRRAVLAFPDEDVLVGTRMEDPAAFRAYAGLTEVVPRPGHKPSGEERAWGRRLAKRFGCDGQLDDRALVLTGDGVAPGLLDYAPRKAAEPESDVAGLFEAVDRDRRDCLVVFGWAMAEDLLAGNLPR
ncbi:MAG: hypothetical protein JWM85_3061 [Acidimicrobiaceae bacterium]|nr:hypothetical protein [Acidimicrobiaceae bacterium]